jgi:hypothetical protein
MTRSAEQTRAAHPRPITIHVGQTREHIPNGSVNRRARLVPNGGTRSLSHPSSVLRALLDMRITFYSPRDATSLMATILHTVKCYLTMSGV